MLKAVSKIVVTFLFLGVAQAQEILVVGEAWEGYTETSGKGVYIELVKEVFEPAGIKVVWETYPWVRATNYVKSKRADAVLGDYYDSEEAGTSALYPSWHISVEDPVIIWLPKRANAHKSWQEAVGEGPVGWIRGYGFEKADWWDPSIQFHEITDLEPGLMMLKAGRLAGILDYQSSLLKAENSVQLDIQFQSRLVYPGSKLYIKFANTERSKSLIKIFDQRMEQLVNSGRVLEIYRSWGHSESKFSADRFEQQDE